MVLVLWLLPVLFLHCSCLLSSWLMCILAFLWFFFFFLSTLARTFLLKDDEEGNQKLLQIDGLLVSPGIFNNLSLANATERFVCLGFSQESDSNCHTRLLQNNLILSFFLPLSGPIYNLIYEGLCHFHICKCYICYTYKHLFLVCLTAHWWYSKNI